MNDRVTNWAFYIIAAVMDWVFYIIAAALGVLGFVVGWRVMDYIRTLL